jgi:hypothetical protein
MAAASYTTDLTDFEDFETASTVTEVTGYIATNKFEDLDGDNPIQGTRHASAEQRNANTGSIVSNGTGTTLAAGEAFFFWQNFLQAGAVNTFALDGIVGIVGTGTNAYYRWTIGGSDFGRNPYGGWANQVCDPTITTGRTPQGSPGTSYSIVGYGCDVITAISKGSPYNLDVIRYGRGEVLVTDGDLGNGYATFEGISTQNDTQTNRWGLFQFQAGSYLWKGLLSLGTATAVDFRDSNRVIVIDNTLVVSSSFNRIEVNNTASNVDWDAINISSLGTVSRGQFEMIDGATLDFNTCVFTDMDTFIFNKGTGKCDLLNTTWRRCRAVTQGGATITGSTFVNTDSGATESLVSTSTTLGSVTGCSFVRTAGTVNAVSISDTISTNTTVTWDGNVLTGYGTGVTGTGVSSTAGGAIEATLASSAVLTISVTNGATIPTVEFTGTGTVDVVASVSVTVSGLLGNTEVSVLQNPSPYSLGGASPTSLFNEDVLSAVTGTDIELDTGGGANITQILRTGTTDFTTMNLVAGDQVRVSQRSNLKIFDTYTVEGTPTASAINVTDVASSTSKLPAIIDSPGETVTVEKVGASYSFEVEEGQVIDILAFRVGSLPIYQLTQTISITNNSFPLTQTVDRNFDAFEV